jgi:hypothetical protein
MKKVNVRLPKQLMDRIREASRRTGLPMSRIARESLEKTFSEKPEAPWRRFAGKIKGGPPDLSLRKGYFGTMRRKSSLTYRRNKREAIPLLTPPKK